MPVLDDETAALLAGGCALILGAVAPGGMPLALRGWGVEVLDTEPLTLRILIDEHEQEAIRHLAAGRPVAITAADVPTLRSVQLKGRSTGVEPSRSGDPDVMLRYVEQFFDDIVDTDGTPRDVLERIVPDPGRLVAVVVHVDERFDQTPGPGAGRQVGADA